MTVRELRKMLKGCRFDDWDVVIDIPGHPRCLTIMDVAETNVRVYIETEPMEM